MKILVSDDQVDVLEAIRLLLKGAGHQTETADSPRAALAAAGTGLVRPGADGHELLARHDLGRRRAGAARQAADARRPCSGDRDDRVVERRSGRRSDAARRGRFHSEALGQRAPARDHREAGEPFEGAQEGAQRAGNRPPRAAAPASAACHCAQNRCTSADAACLRAKSAAITTIFSTSAPAVWACCWPTYREKASRPRC